VRNSGRQQLKNRFLEVGGENVVKTHAGGTVVLLQIMRKNVLSTKHYKNSKNPPIAKVFPWHAFPEILILYVPGATVLSYHLGAPSTVGSGPSHPTALCNFELPPMPVR